jgi:xylose isomerase
MSNYTPGPEHKFTFGLWTVGNTGRAPFGASVRDTKKALSETGLVVPMATTNLFYDPFSKMALSLPMTRKSAPMRCKRR